MRKMTVTRIPMESPTVQIIFQKQLKNVEYFICLVSTITNIKSRIAIQKSAFNKERTPVTRLLD